MLTTSGPSAAAPKPITGKLSKPGYTVIALAANGNATAARAKPRKFKLRPPAKRVTLHLRARDGTYAGPIVVARKKKGKRAILGVKAAAKLGKVKVKARKGYAKVKRTLPRKFVDAKRKARAKKGAPIGAGNFGRVRSANTKGGAPGDRDLDGVPDQLDIDDDGDLILDTVDVSTAARAAQVPPPEPLTLLPILSLGLDQTANANHPALAAHIDTALSSGGWLILGGAASTELDCGGKPDPDNPGGWIGGLRYCTRGGTGRVVTFGIPYSESPPFPGPPFGPFDPDGDGFGTLSNIGISHPLAHGATSAEIKTGDELIARFNDAGGVETGELFTALLPYVFATVPALVSYHDSAVPPNQVTLSYPYPPGVAHELPVAAGPDGDVVVTLTFWRPQRRPIEDEICPPPAGRLCSPDEWVDIGGLVYGAGLGAGECPQITLSEGDDNLTDRPPGPFGVADGFKDSRPPPDRPANPSETLTFTLNITQCLELQGQGSSFDEPGEVRAFHLIAGGGGRADQAMSFKRG